MSDLNIFQRINSVMKKVSYVKKDATVKNYMAVTHDAVTALVRKEMVEAGIVMTVSQEWGEFDAREEGAKMRLYHGIYNVKFINIDNAGDWVLVSMRSMAYDNGDKAPGKAMSYATKYALLKTFMIETGENEESRSFDPGASPISPRQYADMMDLLKKADRTEEQVIDFLNKNGIEVKNLADLTTATYGHVKAKLDSVIEANNGSE